MKVFYIECRDISTLFSLSVPDRKRKYGHFFLTLKKCWQTYKYFFSLPKMPKIVNLAISLKTWSLWSNSVTRQVTFKRTKIGVECQNWRYSALFMNSKCKRSSLRSQCWMRLFIWFFNYCGKKALVISVHTSNKEISRLPLTIVRLMRFFVFMNVRVKPYNIKYKLHLPPALNEERVSRVQKGKSKRSCRDLRYPGDSRGGASLGHHPVNCGDPKFASIFAVSSFTPKTIFSVNYTLGQNSHFFIKQIFLFQNINNLIWIFTVQLRKIFEFLREKSRFFLLSRVNSWILHSFGAKIQLFRF